MAESFFWYLLVPLLIIMWLYRWVEKERALTFIKRINKKGHKLGIAPVLYLRAFEMDGDERGEKIELVDTKYEYFIALDFAKIMRPLRAIDKPEGYFSELGLNIQILSPGDDEWQKTVLESMEYCCLILLRPLYTKGVLWEFEQIVKNGFLHKTILLLQMGSVWEIPVQKARYNIFVRKISELQINFPEYPMGHSFIYFEDKQAFSSNALEQIPIFNSAVIEKENFRPLVGLV